jgi:uncharacterized protein YyaL (SSP411 family)
MRRIVFLHVIIGALLSLSATDWYDNYESAHTQALKENKIFYIFIVSEDCRWCRKMEATTMQDDAISARLGANFIAVELMRDIDTYPQRLQAKMVPKHYFLTPDERKIYAVPGFWNVEDFNSILDDVEKKFKKIKEKDAVHSNG